MHIDPACPQTVPEQSTALCNSAARHVKHPSSAHPLQCSAGQHSTASPPDSAAHVYLPSGRVELVYRHCVLGVVEWVCPKHPHGPGTHVTCSSVKLNSARCMCMSAMPVQNPKDTGHGAAQTSTEPCGRGRLCWCWRVVCQLIMQPAETSMRLRSA